MDFDPNQDRQTRVGLTSDLRTNLRIPASPNHGTPIDQPGKLAIRIAVAMTFFRDYFDRAASLTMFETTRISVFSHSQWKAQKQIPGKIADDLAYFRIRDIRAHHSIRTVRRLTCDFLAAQSDFGTQ